MNVTTMNKSDLYRSMCLNYSRFAKRPERSSLFLVRFTELLKNRSSSKFNNKKKFFYLIN